MVVTVMKTAFSKPKLKITNIRKFKHFPVTPTETPSQMNCFRFELVMMISLITSSESVEKL